MIWTEYYTLGLQCHSLSFSVDYCYLSVLPPSIYTNQCQVVAKVRLTERDDFLANNPKYVSISLQSL